MPTTTRISMSEKPLAETMCGARFLTGAAIPVFWATGLPTGKCD
jgi:hypothetical protein